MKKSRLKLLVAGMIASSLLANAEIAFDLHAQHFSKAIEGEFEGARYELPKTFVSTNLKYVEGRYTTNGDNGYFNIEIKNPTINWSVSLDLTMYLKNVRSLKLISDNGESVVVSFSYKDIHFNSKKVVSSLYYSERVTIGVLQNGNNIELSINGAKVGTASRATFSKLKYVEMQLIQDDGENDDLHSLTIGSK